MNTARYFVNGYATGFNDGLKAGGGGSGGGDEWTPPEDWIPVPEPGEYEAYFLIDIVSTSASAFNVPFGNSEYESGIGSGILVDWGDGNSGIWDGLIHTYSQTGQYLVKFTANEQYHIIIAKPTSSSGGSSYSLIRIAKLGKEIRLLNPQNSNYGFFREQYRLMYVSMSEINIPDYAFQDCYALSRFDGMQNISNIGNSAFKNCYNLRKADLVQCATINSGGFIQCHSLQKVNLPVCTSMGGSAFSYCYSLYDISVPEDCQYASSCFANCYNLYPRPHA